MKLLIIPLILFFTISLNAQTIINGVPWYDQNGNPVNAHGAGIIRDNGKYWLFGEYKSDTTNCFPGFGCYSSEDLQHWHFERVVLPVQKNGILGPNHVGERPKVMRCPKTGQYIMLAHADSTNYNDPHTAIAVSSTVNGNYRLLGTLLYKGKPIRKWDIGVFQDDDDRGYLLCHHGPIYRLSDDYLSVDTMIADVKGMGESPAMFKKNGVYFLLTSHLTSWERNDNYYFTATNIAGPWKRHGTFCPKGSLTWNSQTTFVLTLSDGTPMYMGDRWSYPHQASAATYVWLPMKVHGDSISIPEYWQVWNTKETKPVDLFKSAAQKEMAFISKHKGDAMTLKFKGTQAAVTGETGPDCGYAWVTVVNDRGKEVFASYIDGYSKVPAKGILCVTPALPYGNYRLTVKVAGEKGNWTDKRKIIRYGSHDYYIKVARLFYK